MIFRIKSSNNVKKQENNQPSLSQIFTPFMIVNPVSTIPIIENKLQYLGRNIEDEVEEQCLVQNQPDLLTFKPLNCAVNNYCSCTIFSSGYDHWRPSTYELRNLHEEIRVNSPHSDSVFAQMPTPLYYKDSNQSQNYLKSRSQFEKQPCYKDHVKVKYSLNSITKRQNITYVCKFMDCNREFLKKWNFTEHFKSHSHEKPFECTDCGKRFSQKGSLIKHAMLLSSDGIHSAPSRNQKTLVDKTILK